MANRGGRSRTAQKPKGRPSSSALGTAVAPHEGQSDIAFRAWITDFLQPNLHHHVNMKIDGGDASLVASAPAALARQQTGITNAVVFLTDRWARCDFLLSRLYSERWKSLQVTRYKTNFAFKTQKLSRQIPCCQDQLEHWHCRLEWVVEASRVQTAVE